MKGTLKLIVLSLLLTQATSAQINPAMTLVIDPYYSFPNISGLVARARGKDDNVSDYRVRVLGPVGVRTEFLISDRHGVGIDLVYSNLTVDYVATNSVYDAGTNTTTTTYNRYKKTMDRLRMQARYNFHFDVKDPRLDMYIGLAAGSNQRVFKTYKDGIEIATPENFWNKLPVSPVSFRAHWGARYYFTRNIGGHLEIGIGGPFISAGLSARFGFKRQIHLDGE